MTIEIRNPAADELRRAMEATHVAFAEPLTDENFERHSKMLPLHRFYGAYDDGLPSAPPRTTNSVSPSPAASSPPGA